VAPGCAVVEDDMAPPLLSDTRSAPGPETGDIRYSIVILTWSRDVALQTTLATLKAAMGERSDAEVVLVDNNPDGDDRGRFLSAFAAWQVVKIGRNKGTPARNDGMDVARGEIIVLVDDDVWVSTPGFLDRFGEVFDAHSDVGVVSIRKLDARTMTQLPECIPHTHKGVDALKPFMTFRFIGGVVGMRRSMHRRLGGFNPEFFFGAEEREYSYRIIQNGWKLYYEPSIVAIETNNPGGKKAHKTLMTETVANMFIIFYLYKPFWSMVLGSVLYVLYAYISMRGQVDPLAAARIFLAWRRRAVRSRRKPLDAAARAYIRACGGSIWR
jgi:GT2 family glycosyltransferase